MREVFQSRDPKEQKQRSLQSDSSLEKAAVKGELTTKEKRTCHNSVNGEILFFSNSMFKLSGTH